MSAIKPKRLGDIITLKRGYDLTANDRLEGQYPVISSAGISGYHSEYKVEGEGVVTGRYGTLGKMYFVDEKYWPHNTALYVQDFKGNDPKYIYYLLSCIGRIRTSDKSAVPGVNRNELHEMAIPAIEDKSIQIGIRNQLSNIDKKIELNNKINTELEAMAKLIYDYWFVQFDFPDGNGKPYKSSGGKMVYNEELKREIPEGWEVKSLMDIASFTNGVACQKHRPQDGADSYRVIKIREMGGGFTDSSEWVSKSIPDKVVVNNGDVLFSWSATLSVMIWAGGIGGLNQHIFKVTSDKYPRAFYYFEVLRYLQHFKMMAELRKTTMGHITQDHLKQSRISIPHDGLVESLHEKLNPILNKMVRASEENLKLEELRDWLLPMLMNGQVTIK